MRIRQYILIVKSKNIRKSYLDCWDVERCWYSKYGQNHCLIFPVWNTNIVSTFRYSQTFDKFCVIFDQISFHFSSKGSSELLELQIFKWWYDVWSLYLKYLIWKLIHKINLIWLKSWNMYMLISARLKYILYLIDKLKTHSLNRS